MRGSVTPKLLELLATSKKMGFSEDGLLYAAAELAGKPYKSLEKYEQNLDQWADRKAFTEAGMKQFEQSMARYNDQIRRVLDTMGLHRSVTPQDQALYIHWVEEKGFSQQKVLETAAQVTAPSQKMKRLGELLEGTAPAGFKKTAAHQYDARTNRNYGNVFTQLDELEDDET